MKIFTRLLLILCLILAADHGGAQSKKDLENKKKQLQREIDETNRQLKSTTSSKRRTAGELDKLKKKIKLRQDLIYTINTELNGLGREINKTSGEISVLKSRNEQLKDEYANMIRFAQRNRDSYQRLVFLFAADDFNQAFKRMLYLRQYSEERRKQAMLIDSTRKVLDSKVAELEVKKNEKTGLRNSEEKQRQQLDDERREQSKVLTQLQQQEVKLKKQLAEKQRAKKRLDKALSDLVRKEIEAAKRKAAASGKKNVTSENVFTLTPEALKLSNSFAGNKGKLPWPVEKGTISSDFGEHPHPELKGIVVKNNGVDIRSVKGSQVRSIFDGEVTGVINIPGANSAVIVRHGEYLSVYSNLAAVYVKKGDKVKTREQIGKVFTDPDDDTSELHLEIWKGTTKLDPGSWLAGR
ncbi:MAG TPA: peptidoglycan DD-metalloendopeptidase family protein [Bacteroidia bacterium]|nr:peptidoglycan DD-metalloendopeptidase family protein [Bacteroidia bacterium]